MRTALVLLFLLALAAVPGSVIPQQDIDAAKVLQWRKAHPGLAPVYDRLGLFSVFGSPWFSAIYLLLMISLVGCVVPRLALYWRGMQARPPRVPRYLSRLPESRSFTVECDPGVVLRHATSVLRRRRYRVGVHDGAVSAEKGYLREAGNLLFHFSVLVVLVGFSYGQLFGYKGGVITVVGDGFSNTASQYDDFAPGRLFNPEQLSPVSFTVDAFHVKWVTSGPNMGQPSSFDADLTYRTSPGSAARDYDLKVNHPLDVGGTKVFLVGHGYAPVVTIRDGKGQIAFRGPTVFLPQDSSFASYGVVKVPDAAPQQLGFVGNFLPTYGFTMATGAYSQFPDALDPALVLTPWHGNLGLDKGIPQSVYTLDRSGLKRFPSSGTANPYLLLKLRIGQTKKLPGNLGSIRFDGVQRWVKLQVSHQPGTPLALAGVLVAILGLMGSLFIRPRRAWVRVSRRPDDPDRAGQPPHTLVELAGLDRTSGGDLAAEVDAIERLLLQAVTPGASPIDEPSAQEETP